MLGIECAGEVVAAPGSDLPFGQRVVAMMGGMGRQFDGSYAEYVLVPQQNVSPLQTQLEWKRVAALPEMLQTVHGSLHVGLEIERANNILVRGATSSADLEVTAPPETWLGNVRELGSLVKEWCLDALFAAERGKNSSKVIELKGSSLGPGLFSPEFLQTGMSPIAPPEFPPFMPGDKMDQYLEKIEISLLKNAMEANNNNQTHAARELGISRGGLIKKLKRMGH